MSQDPISFVGGLNFYAYVANNPVNYSDPFGLMMLPGIPPPIIIPPAPPLPTISPPVAVAGGNGIDPSSDPTPPDDYGKDDDQPDEDKEEENTAAGDPTFIQISNKVNNPHIAKNDNGLTVKISVPYEDSLVRANIPIFGLAYG